MKTNGILMALSSLPSDTGVGDLYESAYEFIKCLKEAKIKIWQLLPLNPVGYGSSPYQSECGEAIDPIYISLKYLKENNYIKEYKTFNKLAKRVDFDKVRNFKETYFKEAFKNLNTHYLISLLERMNIKIGINGLLKKKMPHIIQKTLILPHIRMKFYILNGSNL